MTAIGDLDLRTPQALWQRPQHAGGDDRYAVRGYISTAAKHGALVLTAIHGALAGNSWMLPIPEPP
jgi:hypothetical protein